MNLDEAIKRAKEVASEQKRRSCLCTTSDNECDKFSSCIKREVNICLKERKKERQTIRLCGKANELTTVNGLYVVV